MKRLEKSKILELSDLCFLSDEDFEEKLRQKWSKVVLAHSNGKKLKYRNIIQWVEYGLNLKTIRHEYRMQYEILRDLFSLRCPFCSNDEYDELMELDIELERSVCPKCGYIKDRMDYNTLVLCCGMRSGKTATAAMIASWIYYLVLNVPRLDKLFGLLPGQRLRVSMIATAQLQASKTIWGTFEALINNASDEEIRSYLESSRVRDEELKRTGKEWEIGNVDFMCLHSNSGSLAGGTGILVCLDELSRFVLGSSFRSATEVYSALLASLKTVREYSDSYLKDMFGLLVISSSPFYVKNDPTLTALYGENYTSRDFRLGQKWSDGKKLCVHMSTWDFNKKFSRESFNEDFVRDYWTAMRDFGADPTQSKTRLFEDMEILENALVDPSEVSAFFDFNETILEMGKNISYLSANCKVIGNFWGKNYVVHVDLGHVKDLLSMVFAHKDDDSDIIWIDGILVLEPRKDLSIYVDTPYDVIVDLMGKVGIEGVSYDQWQSLSALQRLQRLKINTLRRSVGDEDILLVKSLLLMNRLKIVNYGKGINYLRNEFLTVERGTDGKLSHTDVLVALAGAVAGINKRMEFRKVGVDKVSQIEKYNAFVPKVARFRRW